MRKLLIPALLVMCSCATAPAKPDWQVEFPNGDEASHGVACLKDGHRLTCYDLAAFLDALAQQEADKREAAHPSMDL